MSDYLSFFILIPYVLATAYAICELSKSKEDLKKRYVAYIFIYSTLSFAIILPKTTRFLSQLTGIPSISRLLMDISDIFALFYALMFLREFKAKKATKKPLLIVVFTTTAALTALFFAAKLRSDLLFTIDEVKNNYFFAYNLIFELYYVPIFLYCTLKFIQYSRAAEFGPSKFRLSFLSFGCATGLLFGTTKTIHLLAQRFDFSFSAFNMAKAGHLFSLIMGVSLSIGLLWPKTLENASKSMTAAMSYKRIHFDLLSLLAVLNDIRSILIPYANHDMIRYVRLIGGALELPQDELEMIVEASKLCITRLDPDITIRKDRSSKEGDLSLAFMEEIEFYQEIYKQLKYRKERYDGKETRGGLSKEGLPVGSRIIKIVSAYLEEMLINDNPAQAINKLKSGAGREFDPKIIEIFINLLEKEVSKV